MLPFASRFVALMLAVVACGNIIAAEPNDAEIKALIEQLASPNKAPKDISDHVGPDVIYPAGYQHKAQEKVLATYNKLKQLGPRAFPLLASHTDDERYSLTGDTGSIEENLNVGFLCEFLLREQISPFASGVAGEGYTTGKAAYDNLIVGPRGDRPGRPDFFSHVGHDKKWLAENKTSSLHYIQTQVLEWMIAEEAKDPRTYDAEERNALKQLLRELNESQGHITSGRFFFAK